VCRCVGGCGEALMARKGFPGSKGAHSAPRRVELTALGIFQK